MSDAVIEGAVCQPNFSAAGRKRRRRVSLVAGVVAVVGLLAALWLHVPAGLRALVALPAAVSVLSGLQVRRNTCVAHAATGTFEHEDFTTSKVDAALAAASKRVAATIYRDALIVGALVALISVASSWVY